MYSVCYIKYLTQCIVPPSPTTEQHHDIKIEFHPHAERTPEFYTLEEYGVLGVHEVNVPRASQPWQPFRSRIDFEVAELALQAAMNKDQVNVLLSLMQCCATGQENFTLTSHSELCDLWDHASNLHNGW